MFLREASIYSRGFWSYILAAALLVTGCAVLLEGSNAQKDLPPEALSNGFTVAPQVSPPRNIQSVQLYRTGSPASPPVIRLESDERLTLAFDLLDTRTRQFVARIRHYSSNWEKSGLNPNYYIDGFFEDYLGGGIKSYTQRPAYRHFEYSFPNRQFSLTVSGNYLLSIYDADNNELLFALPFFVTEDEGSIESRVEKLFARREDLREQDQLFSNYRYPAYVELPSFDLSFFYVQNRFWGRARSVRFFDTSTPGMVHFHLSQEEAFLGDYEFKILDVRSLSADGSRIVSYEPGTIPPQVILRRDIQALDPVSVFRPGPVSGFGLPLHERDARYAKIQFKLETRKQLPSGQEVYLVGDFNGWSINELNRMEFDRASDLWEGSALVKQGEYAYKYVVAEDNRIDDLFLDRSFTFSRQEYFTLVYFRDPTRHFDRLLKVGHIPR